MDIQGEDGKSRQRKVTSSLPDMWLEAMSSVIPPSSLIWVLKLFLGDIGEQVPWHVAPHVLAGRASFIVGEPFAAESTLSNIREAANMDLATSVLVLIPRRMFTEWFQLARKFTCLGDFPAGSVFNGFENFERYLVLFMPHFRCSLPHHDPKKLIRLQDESAAEQQLRNMQRAIPEDRSEAYLRTVAKILAEVAKLPSGSASSLLQASVASACAKIAEQEAVVRETGSGLRCYGQQTLCLPMVRRLVAAWGRRIGGSRCTAVDRSGDMSSLGSFCGTQRKYFARHSHRYEEIEAERSLAGDLASSNSFYNGVASDYTSAVDDFECGQDAEAKRGSAEVLEFREYVRCCGIQRVVSSELRRVLLASGAEHPYARVSCPLWCHCPYDRVQKGS